MVPTRLLNPRQVRNARREGVVMCHASWAHCRPHRSFDPGSYSHPGPWTWGGFMSPFGGEEGFGVRRPLRFLAHKLELDEKQVVLLARILDELKTERAQAAVDDRRSLADFADALAGEQFDSAKAGDGADRRVESARRL